MPQVNWTPGAAADVQRMYRFLMFKNPAIARKALKAIRNGVMILVRQPHIGRPIEDMPAEFRDWPIGFGDSGYVARYHIEVDMVTILSVRHQKEAGF